MRLELPHFEIEGEYGANQEKYTDFWMHLGGCAATCACESALLFKKYHGLSEAYPYDTDEVTREQFNAFTLEMKPYLRPRMMGIDKLSLYMDGFSAYLHDRGVDCIRIGELPGEVPYEQAEEAVRRDTGARALRSIIEEFMLDIMYEIPKDDTIGTVTITGDYILGKGAPVIEMRA